MIRQSKLLNTLQRHSKSLTILSLSALMMSLSACTTHTLIPQSLLVPCKNPQSLIDGNAETVGYLLIENAKEQMDCKLKHDAIIKIVTP